MSSARSFRHVGAAWRWKSFSIMSMLTVSPVCMVLLVGDIAKWPPPSTGACLDDRGAQPRAR
ncbi:MAG: hypothetical protein ABIP49_11035 [Lysobacterales bacterium]